MTFSDLFQRQRCSECEACLLAVIRRRHSALHGICIFRRTTGVMWALIPCPSPVEEGAFTFTCSSLFQDYLRNHCCWTSRGSSLC
ncbi:hypothetical protein RLOC_00010577 [Lonchura striata]|uniref:Uncharacterized protein n=1 Tax=Lonchura striata TaxID=40157 RepID=A0A218UUZ9_9PASE|nr:hypothetical protein RLOC_00010577 [Lonchura striata domestica]